MIDITTYSTKTPEDSTEGALLALIIVAIILLALLSIAALYLISTLRRSNVVLKKVDYLIEDITYKSESLNVTVETLNKVSNYALSLDAVSQNGFKSMLKLVSENRNYIYSILDKMRKDVEDREMISKAKNKVVNKTSTAKKAVNKKVSTATKKTNTTKKTPTKKISTTTKTAAAKKPATKTTKK